MTRITDKFANVYTTTSRSPEGIASDAVRGGKFVECQNAEGGTVWLAVDAIWKIEKADEEKKTAA